MNLPSWTGIVAGVERLTRLLSLLSQFFIERTTTAVALPLSSTIDVLTRMLAVSVSSSTNRAALETRQEFVKEEKEGLSSGLSQIHMATLEVISTMVERLGGCFLPLSRQVLEHVVWAFSASGWNENVRRASYAVAGKILDLSGLSLPQSLISQLSPLIQRCCADRLPHDLGREKTEPDIDTKSRNEPRPPSTNADAYLGTSPSSANALTPLSAEEASSDLQESARALLPLFLTCIHPDHLEFSVRSQIDRTAILAQDHAAVMASVLQPARLKNEARVLSSIMPHLARASAHRLEVEGLIRPRMPVTRLPVYSEAVVFSDPGSQEGISSQGVVHAGPANPGTKEPSEPMNGEEQPNHHLQSLHDPSNAPRALKRLSDSDATPSAPHTSPPLTVASSFLPAPSGEEAASALEMELESGPPLKKARLEIGQRRSLDHDDDAATGKAEDTPSALIRPHVPPATTVTVIATTAIATATVPSPAHQNDTRPPLRDDDSDDSDSSNFVMPPLVIDPDTDEEMDRDEEEEEEEEKKEEGLAPGEVDTS
ncbi:MAG: hypothetical protein M1826_001878 [Phylliscum demangeonii]|nr:MAG: hypothetical protein M1826_001878 [Phylliscum demangeonii]